MSSQEASPRGSPLADAVATSRAPLPPFPEPPFRELNMASLGALPFLIHDLERQQYLAEVPLFRKEQPVNHVLPVNFDLPDITSQMIDIGVSTTRATNLFHRRGYCRRILISQLVQELTHGLTSGCTAIEAPLPTVA
jgi:hypothetical protein